MTISEEITNLIKMKIMTGDHKVNIAKELKVSICNCAISCKWSENTWTVKKRQETSG